MVMTSFLIDKRFSLNLDNYDDSELKKNYEKKN